MTEYHKIQGLYKRDPDSHRFIEGQYSLPEFEYLKDNRWDFTEKIDGTNIRVIFLSQPTGEGVTVKPQVLVRGKTDRAQLKVDLVEKVLSYFPVKKMAATFGCDICLYGEGYGAGIQKMGSKYLPSEKDFILFDVRIGHWWLKREDVAKIAADFGVRCVPSYGSSTLDDAVELIKGGLKSSFGDFLAEGIVARPMVELKARNGGRIITKLKHKDFSEWDEVKGILRRV